MSKKFFLLFLVSLFLINSVVSQDAVNVYVPSNLDSVEVYLKRINPVSLFCNEI